MPDFNSLSTQIDVIKAKIDALTASALTPEDILYVSETLATLANNLGVDDIVAATAYAVTQIQDAEIATVAVVEGTANGQVVSDLQDSYTTLQASYDNIEPRVNSVEGQLTLQQSDIATATLTALSVKLNDWQAVIDDYLAVDRDRLFVDTKANTSPETTSNVSMGGAGAGLYATITFGSNEAFGVGDKFTVDTLASDLNNIEFTITAVYDPNVTGSATFGAVVEYGYSVAAEHVATVNAWMDQYNLEAGSVAPVETISYTTLVPTITAITITLPSAPDMGARVEVVDVSGDALNAPFTITKDPSDTIQGINDDVVFNIDNGSVVFVYAGSNYGWRII